MTNAWMRLSRSVQHGPRMEVHERLGIVIAEIGPSITITSLTNALGFGLGAVAPVPEIQLFCVNVALAMLLDLFFQLFFYAPFLVILARYERNASNRTSNDNQSGWSLSLKRLTINYLGRDVSLIKYTVKLVIIGRR